MSDDNVFQFKKVHDEAKSNKAISIEDRVIQCMSNKDCECLYCNYRNNAAQMAVDFIAMDIVAFEKNSNVKFCTFDMKDIFFKAILEIKKMEREPDGEEGD